MRKSHATLLIHCPDRKGIVAEVTRFLLSYDANVVDIEQHVDPSIGHFFMRVEWDLSDFEISRSEIGTTFQEVIGHRFDMVWQLQFTDVPPRMAIFVSKESHCLYDILQRYESGEWRIEIPLIISNHERLRGIADRTNIKFHHLPITKENKAQQEATQIRILQEAQIDFIVLARYMQILTDKFVRIFENKIINIHHSFLPAFAGARPYHQAHERGVKIIGATSHFVTANLDEGPIITQDVEAISHRDSVDDMKRKGRDLEKQVLSRAIWLQLQHKILPLHNKTVIF